MDNLDEEDSNFAIRKEQQYEYSTFDVNSGPKFRLLRLQGGTGGEIQCEIVNADFDEKNLIPYDAISYTWGSKLDPMRCISIGEKTLLVIRNVYAVLNHLRHPYQDRILWIDGICIDQKNNVERSHQIQQMTNIYSRAEEVHVWLGQPSDDSPLIMKFLAQLQERLPSVTHYTDQELEKCWLEARFEMRVYYDVSDTALKDSLKFVLDQPYFRRVWILQEVANAKRLSVHCGMKSVSGKILAIAPTLLGLEHEIHCQAVLDLMGGPRKRPSWWSKGRNLYDLMRRFAAAEATEDRDKIYALLGMCENATLEVDYNATTEMVIRQTISCIYQLPLKWIPSIPYRTIPEFSSNIESVGTIMLEELLESGFYEAVWMLLQRQGRNIAITSSILEKAAANETRTIELLGCLLRHPVAQKKLTSGVLKAVAKNRATGARVLRFLFEFSNPRFVVTEDLLEEAATMNIPAVMAVLLSERNAASHNTKSRFYDALINQTESWRPWNLDGDLVNQYIKKTVARAMQQAWWVQGLALLSPGISKELNEVADQCARKGPLYAIATREILAQQGLDCPFESKMTEMSLAAGNGQARTILKLVESGHDVRARDGFGWAALDYAVAKVDWGVMDLLLRMGAKFSDADSEGRTALFRTYHNLPTDMELIFGDIL